MVIYECDNCKKKFNQKGHYMRHLNRKYPCKKTEQNLNLTDYSINGIHIPKLEYNNTCMYCKKIYSTKFNLNKHQKTCKKKEEIEMKTELYNLLLLETQKKIEEENLYLKQQINKLQNQLTKNISIINTNNNNFNNNTINILAYKDTDLSHLSDKDFEYIMKKCYKSVPTLIEKTHFNPDKPENKNIIPENPIKIPIVLIRLNFSFFV